MKTTSPRNARGFSLIEVMIAVIVLAVGLLALAVLQGELFRSGSEAKARANAATIAQQVIEDARTFGFVSAPDAGYVGNTYNSLADDAWTVEGVSGVTFDVVRDVARYRYDEDADTFEVDEVTAFSVAVPEFKLVRVAVSWTDSNGDAKSVQMVDSIAAISPADVAKVMEGAPESAQGPTVWIEPPNKDNPRVVPIAVGDNQSAASSNPTPEQFIEDVSAITRFSVMSFVGATDAAEVQLTRKLDMAAASCVCQLGSSSTSTNPAYKPTIWNGVQLAYEEPETMPVGTATGTAVVANADSESEPMCTICCRDHFNQGDRSPLPDPYRATVDDAITTRYGYKKQGSSYNVANLLDSTETDGLYMDACQLVRVNGRMRMTVDAQQTALVTTSLDDSGNTYRIADFIDLYSGYVTTILEEGLGTDATMPTGYPSPDAKFPGPSTSVDATYATIVEPAPVQVAKDDVVNLVSFGLYVDYLSDDTLLAYKCALDGDTTGDCIGLGERAPLDVLPFYAVNVASLGDWSSASTNVVSVAGAGYDNQGSLTSVGGIATGGATASPVDGTGAKIPTPVTLTINDSNSGLAGTAAVDMHDKLSSSYVADPQGFTNGDSTDPDPDPEPTTNTLTIGVINAYATNLNSFTVTMTGASCVGSNQNKNWVCTFNSPLAAGATVTFGGYQKNTANPDRMVCRQASSAIISGDSVAGAGTSTETSSITLTALNAADYVIDIDVVNSEPECSATNVKIN